MLVPDTADVIEVVVADSQTRGGMDVQKLDIALPRACGAGLATGCQDIAKALDNPPALRHDTKVWNLRGDGPALKAFLGDEISCKLRAESRWGGSGASLGCSPGRGPSRPGSRDMATCLLARFLLGREEMIRDPTLPSPLSPPFGLSGEA